MYRNLRQDGTPSHEVYRDIVMQSRPRKRERVCCTIYCMLKTCTNRREGTSERRGSQVMYSGALAGEGERMWMEKQ